MLFFEKWIAQESTKIYPGKAANNYVTKLLSKRTQVDTVGVSRVCPIKCCSEKSNRLVGCLLSQLGDPILVLSLKLFTNRLRQLTIIL